MKNKITPLQLFFILLQAQIGLGIFWIDKQLFQTAKNNSWLSVIIAGLGTQIMISVIWYFTKKYKYSNTTSLLRGLLNHKLGTCISSFYTIYFLCVQILIVFMLAQILQQWVLPETPTMALIIITVISILYTSGHSIQSHVYFYSFMSIITAVCFLFFIPALQNVDIRYLFPIMHMKQFALLKGAAIIFVIFSGFETLLFYMGYVKEKDDPTVYKAATWANIAMTVFYTFVVFIITTSFSPEALKNTPQPIVAIFKGYQYGMINRYDDLFLGLWLFMIISSVINYSFLATQNMYIITNKKWRLYKLSFVNAAIVFSGAVYINNIQKVNNFKTFFGWLCLGATIIIPLLLAIKTFFTHKEIKQ